MFNSVVLCLVFTCALAASSAWVVAIAIPFIQVTQVYPDHFTYHYYLAFVAIFRNEAAYIPEWLEYHLLVGVDKFFLYDNDSDDHPEGVLCPYIRDGLVNFTRWP